MNDTKNIQEIPVDSMEISIEKVETSRVSEVDFNDIPFGKIFSDHMFMVDYHDGKWINPKLMPYRKIPMSPATAAIHYGQSIFEGMKAYKDIKENVVLFRPVDNIKRLNKSAIRMCMPEIPEDLFMNGLMTLLRVDAAWVPPLEGCSLYVRPVMFSTTEEIKVRTADKYKFVILSCPVGPYYPKPLKVAIETHYSRACQGGVGFTKAAGNYGAALYPASILQAKGYDQLIWTDAKEHKYIEESGTMNIMFVINDTIITPPVTNNTILPGITRDSVITLARDSGIKVEERPVSVDEIATACKKGSLQEAFGVGTAATIAHIATIAYEGTDYTLPAVEYQKIGPALLKRLADIRKCRVADPYGWVVPV